MKAALCLNNGSSHKKEGGTVPKNTDYDLYCPECNKKAGTLNPMFIRYSMYRLQLPIFFCGECRTIYIDKPIVRGIISRWRKNSPATQSIPFNQLCREFIGELAKSLREHWVPYLGYKRAHFLKRPVK
ncbi:MAG: hypothetical protein AAB345_01615 [Patescibacteria group bacterium]